jgi:hypothetical protein
MLKYWTFMQEGLGVLNRITDMKVDRETFFRVIADVITGAEDNGKVLVIADQCNIPLFYIVAFNNTSKYHDKRPSMLVYAAYSNKRSKYVTRFGLSWIEEWARRNAYKEVQAFSPRINGAGFRLFESVFNFKRRSVLFYKTL